MKQIEPEELPGLGWIRIHDTGEENIYFEFEDQGRIREGFCKVDSYHQEVQPCGQ